MGHSAVVIDVLIAGLFTKDALSEYGASLCLAVINQRRIPFLVVLIGQR